jgi:hypothetical protein
MTVRMTMMWTGLTPDNYDAVCVLANWEGDPPAGGLFHVASFADGALHVTDAWENAADFEAFAATRLMPAVAKAGITLDPPSVTIEPVHEFQTDDIDSTGGVVEEVFFPGITAAQWDDVKREVGWENTPPVGGRAHLAVVRPDGISVSNVWRSAGEVERFRADRALPAMAKVGVAPTGPPIESIREIYRLFDVTRQRVR